MSRPESAPLPLRLLAMLYDLFVLTALWMLTATIALAITHGGLDAQHPPVVYRLALLAVAAAYCMISWVRGGQTIGMRAWRLRVVDADGKALSWSRAGLRFGVSLLSLIACGFGFLWCLVDRDRRSWHDIAAGTRLLRVPKPQT